jgi:hypothetical protein
MEGRVPVEVESLNFNTDKAATADYFNGPHQRVADAIVAALQHTDVKTIGLIGPWGSGKSTVIKLVEQGLAEAHSPKFHLFTYDAWIHQSDPARRAFLEQLIAYLKQHKIGAEGDRKAELDAVQKKKDETDTTTTPVLTSAGRWLLLPILLLPLAYLFLGRPWYEAWAKPGSGGWNFWPFSAALIVVALLPAIAFILYYSWRPLRLPFQRGYLALSNWTTHRAPHQNESILSLISNRHVVQQHTTAVRGDEPTALEFQQAFRRILGWVIAKKHKLVIVVDNLDRLDRNEAIRMWTTIRSFFLGAIAEDEKVSRSDLPSVILPIDASATMRAQNADVRSPSGEKSDAGRAFMDKSFDVIFHVAPPVLTNWQSFLSKTMREVFGEGIDSSWISETTRIYRYKADTEPNVTPRDIGRAVNAVAAVWLQSKDLNIPFASIAYYAIYRTQFENNLSVALDSLVVDISDSDPNWRTSLAALHYGVEPDVAIQVFLDAPLRNAIARGNSAAFARNAKIAGFGTAIERLLHDTAFMSIENTTQLILLLPSISADEPWVAFAWSKLARRFAEGDLYSGTSGQSFKCVETLIGHQSGTKRHELLRAVVAAIARWPEPVVGGSSVIPLAKIIGLIAQTAKDENVSLPKLPLKGEASVFLELASLLYENEAALSFLLASCDTTALPGELVEQLSSQSAERLDEKTRIVLASSPADTGALIETAARVLKDDEPGRDAQSAATIILGSLFKSTQEAYDALRECAKDGHVQELLNYALMEPDADLASRTFALLLLVGHPIETPENKSWKEILGESPELPAMIEKSFSPWRENEFFALLIQQIDNDPEILPLVRRTISVAIEAGDVGILPIPDILSNPDRFTSRLSAEDQSAFLDLAAMQDDFWAKLAETGASASALKLHEELLDSPTTKIRIAARKELAAKLKVLAASDWLTAVRDDSEVLTAGRCLQTVTGRSIALERSLSDPLTQLMPELIASEERPYAARWFEAAGFLAANYRRTLFKDLRDQLLVVSPPPRLEGLLSAGGSRFFEEADFDAKSDEVMRLIVKPLIRSGGLTWLLEQQDMIARWYKKSSSDTRSVIRDRIAEAKEDLGDEDRSRADLLLNKLKRR